MSTRQSQLQRSERLARAVGGLRRRLVSAATGALEAGGTPLVHWQLVSAIAWDGLHSQVALAARVSMDPAATSRALDELEAKGLVRRARDTTDRRRVSVSLSAAGRRWYERARVQVFGEISPIFDVLSPTDARQLEDLLTRLTNPTG